MKSSPPPVILRLSACVVALFSIASCRANHDREPAPKTSPSTSSAGTGTTPGAGAMLRHEVIAASLRESVIRNDLAGAERLARQLAKVDKTAANNLAPRADVVDYAARLEAMRIASLLMAIESATNDVSRAGAGLGALAKTCSDCHARLGGPTHLDIVPLTTTQASSGGIMKRHAWAEREMWNSIVGNSDGPWREAAAVLTSDSGRRAGDNTTETQALQTIGKRAMDTSDMTERSVLYGELVATCGGCHSRGGITLPQHHPSPTQ